MTALADRAEQASDVSQVPFRRLMCHLSCHPMSRLSCQALADATLVALALDRQ
jgi:hypothetical protein